VTPDPFDPATGVAGFKVKQDIIVCPTQQVTVTSDDGSTDTINI